MKRILPGLALLLTGTAVLLRTGSAGEPTAATARPAAQAAPRPNEVAVEAESGFRTPTAVAATFAPAAPAPDAVVKAEPVPTPWALLGVLDRSLLLTELQKRQALEIFRERDRKVEEYGVEVAQRGWAQLKEFELRVGALREDAYRRFAALLDAFQAAEFARQVAVGIPEDHLSIEIPDGLVLLD